MTSPASAAAEPAVVTIGETLISLRSSGPFALPTWLQATAAGAESTVAIGLARLGHSVRWLSRVSVDEYGESVLRSLRGENVDVSFVARDDRRPTGLMILSRRTADLTRVSYWRAGSAASALTVEDVVPGVGHPRILHLTGITPALGVGAARACLVAAQQVHHDGGLVSLDVNYRSRLWSPEMAQHGLAELVELADIIIASEEELPLVASGDEDSAVCGLLNRGARTVLIKRGAAGASLYDAAGRLDLPAVSVSVVDPVGAGDAFVAGYLSGLLDGLEKIQCLDRAVRLGAFAVGVVGDWAGLPTRDELGLLDDLHQTTQR